MVSAASRFGVASMNILSIQSHVAYGHVGNSAAVFALQRLGVEVWPIHTVQFSNHTGYGTARGRAFDGGADPRTGAAASPSAACWRAATACCRATWARPRSAPPFSTRSAQVKRANPRALYCCDPVIGDVGRGVFVQPDIAEFMRARAVPAADIVTPNHFELDRSDRRARRGLCRRRSRRSRCCARSARASVLVTSLVTDETPADAIDLVGLRRRRPLSSAHAQAADRGARRGRRHRGAVLRALPAHRLRCRGAVARRPRRFSACSNAPPQAGARRNAAGRERRKSW